MKFVTVVILAVFLFSGCDIFRGPAGPDGPRGEKGDQGPQGETGEKGDQGKKGKTGLDGAHGVQGEKGNTGPRGPHGEKGDTVYTEFSIDENIGCLLVTGTSWSYVKTPGNSSCLTVTGIAKNVGSSYLEYVIIYIKSYDSTGLLISSCSDRVDKSSLDPGQESPFIVSDCNCNQEPDKVTCGYCFLVTINAPVQKRLSLTEPD